MGLRYKFGPSIHVMPSSTPPTSPPAGALQDVEVSSSATAVRASDTVGEIDVDIAFAVPAYDPATYSALVTLVAIAYGDGQALDIDPEAAVNSSQPKGSVDATGQTSGVTLTTTILGAPMPTTAPLAVLTVLVFDDPDPAPGGTATPVPGDVDPATTG